MSAKQENQSVRVDSHATAARDAECLASTRPRTREGSGPRLMPQTRLLGLHLASTWHKEALLNLAAKQQ